MGGTGIIPADAGSTRPDELKAIKQGIIPADAGSTERDTIRPLRRRDHPRGCGEHHTVAIKDNE